MIDCIEMNRVDFTGLQIHQEISLERAVKEVV